MAEEKKEEEVKDEVSGRPEFISGRCLKVKDEGERDFSYRPQSIDLQADILNEALRPRSGQLEATVLSRPLPPGSEGWFVIPRWQSVAPTYLEATKLMFRLLEKSRGRFWHGYGSLKEKSLRLSPKTAESLDLIAADQPGHDLLLVPGQFGSRYAGRSSIFFQTISSQSREFGFGPFEVAAMLLANPGRLSDPEELWISCPGVDYDFGRGQGFQGVVIFRLLDGRVDFNVAYQFSTMNSGASTGFYRGKE